MGKVVDMVGQRFGRLKVVSRADPPLIGKSAAWHCQCDCGKTIDVRGFSLRTGNTRSCGCLSDESRRERAVDLVGQTFGCYKVTSRANPPSNQHKQAMWDCVCTLCGATTSLSGNTLKYKTPMCECQGRKPCKPRRNSWNSKRSNPQSGVVGVNWNRKKNKWQAAYRGHYIGIFKTIPEAAEAIEKYKEENKIG